MSRLTVGLAAAATVIIVGLVGVFAVSLPPKCDTAPAGSGACPAAAVRPVAVAAPEPAPAAVASPAVGVASATGLMAPGPSSLIDATFGQLPGTAASAAGRGPASPTALASTGPAAPAMPGTAAAPRTRYVSTVPVRPGAALAGVAAPGGPGLSPPTASPTALQAAAGDDAETAIAEAAPMPAPPPADRAVAAYMQDSTPLSANSKGSDGSGDLRVVSGTGVTVRSGPSAAREKLFALGPGEKVTVSGTQRGWLQIVDSHGRRGWAYSTYFGHS